MISLGNELSNLNSSLFKSATNEETSGFGMQFKMHIQNNNENNTEDSVEISEEGKELSKSFSFTMQEESTVNTSYSEVMDAIEESNSLIKENIKEIHAQADELSEEFFADENVNALAIFDEMQIGVEPENKHYPEQGIKIQV